MTTALIKIDGVLGEGISLTSGIACSLTNNDDTGVLTWAWTLVSVPVGSGSTLTGATTATATFTPDIIGSYLISLTVNSALTDEDIDGSVARLITTNLGQYIPALFETTEAGVAGWSIRINNFLRAIDVAFGNVSASNVYIEGFNNTGGGFVNGNIVYFSGHSGTLPYTIKVNSSILKPNAIVLETVPDQGTSKFFVYGDYISSLNASSGYSIGDPIFCDGSGALTLSRTQFPCGFILTATTNAKVLIDFVNAGGYRVKEEFIPIEWAEDGGVAPATSETIIDTNGKIRVRKFSGTVSEDVVIPWIVPENIWVDLGITFISQLLITESTAPSSEGVATVLSGYSRGDGDSLDGTFGSEIESNTGNISDAQYDLRASTESGKVTITDLAGGETAMLKLYRDHDSANDTYGQDIGIIGIRIYYVVRN